MVDKREQYNAIKNAFEAGTRKAPGRAWDTISGNLDKQKGNDILREKVAQSFELHQKTAPQHVWTGVNRQLNIDRTWNNLRRVLDKYSATKRFARYAAAMLMLIILSVATAEYYQLFTGGHHENPASSFPGDAHSRYNNGTTPQDEAIAPAKIDKTNQLPVLKEVPTINITPANAPKATAESVLAFNLTRMARPAKIEAIPVTKPVIQPVAPTETPAVYASTENNKATAQFSRFGVGVVAGLNKTTLLNNETRMSEDSRSLISSSTAFGLSYGITARYAITQHGSLHASFYFADRVKQTYHTYIKGIYTQKEIVLDYKKITLSYQRNLLTNMAGTSITSYVRGGLYQAWLTSANVSYNRVGSASQEYITYDNGINLQVGQQAGKGKLKIAYGLNFEQGRNNIYSGNKIKPADFNVTITRRMGAFTELFYTF